MVLRFRGRDADASYWAHMAGTMLDYYQVLGVPPDTDAASLRTAYRRRAKLLHPDRHIGQTADVVAEATRAMSELTEAFEVLSDTRRRSQYDRGRSGRNRDSPNSQATDEEPRTVADRAVEALLRTMHDVLADADQSFDSATGALARFVVGVAATQVEAALDIAARAPMGDDKLPCAVAYVAVGMAVDIAYSDGDMLDSAPSMLGSFGALLRARMGAELDEEVLMHLPRMSTPPARATARRAATWPKPGASGPSGSAQNGPAASRSSTVVAILILIAMFAVAAANATNNANTKPASSASSAATSPHSASPPSAGPWVTPHDCLVQSASDHDSWLPVSCSWQHDAVIVSVHRNAPATRCSDSHLAFDDDWGAYCAALW